jgi:molybdopterin molybdotransferase
MTADLLNVDEAVRQILQKITPIDEENISFMQGFGRILAENVVSEVDLPPFANSSVDGYAVRSDDLVQIPTTLQVVLDIPAGSFPQRRIQPGEAARIMTGAPIPEGADAVIMVEDTDSEWQLGGEAPRSVEIRKKARPGENVRPIGENVRQGQQVLRRGMILRPQDIGMLASIGQTQVKVARSPRIAILTTGDELVAADEPLSPGKIRDANSYMLAALVIQYGGIPLVQPIAPDRLEAVRTLFQNTLAQKPDMVVSTAGVSVGAADYVRTVLDELGEINFWRINLRPGKPLAFGLLDQGRVPFFGLPGNPVSAMVTFDVIVRPALFRMQGRVDTPETVMAVIDRDVPSDGRRSYIRVTLSRENGKIIARETGTQSSGALMSMVLADGLMIIPEGVTLVKSGTEVTVRLLRNVN